MPARFARRTRTKICMELQTSVRGNLREKGSKPTRVFDDRGRKWSTSPSLRETVLFTRERSALTSFDVGTAKNKYDLITGCLNKTAIDR